MGNMTDIPDMLYQYQDVPAIPWDGDDFVDPETEPMPQLDEAIEIVRKTHVALESITERYVSLAGSGDCGFWNPEQEVVVIGARAAIKEAGQWLAAHTNDESSKLPW